MSQKTQLSIYQQYQVLESEIKRTFILKRVCSKLWVLFACVAVFIVVWVILSQDQAGICLIMLVIVAHLALISQRLYLGAGLKIHRWTLDASSGYKSSEADYYLRYLLRKNGVEVPVSCQFGN